MHKTVLAYLLILLVFGAGIGAALRVGKQLDQPPPSVSVEAKTDSGMARAIATLRDNLSQPLSMLLVQLIVIVVLARIFGALARRVGQPAVIGEMAAGIVLGPSVLGGMFPHFFAFVFPASSLGALRILSQIGVILFMFLVGMELDLRQARRQANTALMVSHVSIIFPCFLGVLFALYIFQTHRLLVPATDTFAAFGLFMGIAMSITAFPVLARILQERGMTTTPLGSTALTCAAVGDLTAWCILAFIVAIVKAGGLETSVATLVLALGFIAVMWLLVRPLLDRLTKKSMSPPNAAPSIGPGAGVVVAMLIVVFASALFTEVIGIHALFGAFLAGVVMPNGEGFRSHLEGKLENFCSALLLPLFFAFTGLRAQMGLLQGWEDWLICAGIILAASVGKLGGTTVTARCTGMNWRDSFALGALMNTRGLVELIVLNLGLDLGILSPTVFTMMVVMALVTTAMTGPLLSMIRISTNGIPASSS